MLYLANDKYNSNLSQSYTVGDNVLYIDEVPENVPAIITAAKGTDQETIFSCTGKTGTTVTGVQRLRGANTNLDAGIPVTCLNHEEFINQFQSEGVSAWNDEEDGSTVTFDLSLSKKQRVEFLNGTARTLAIDNVTNGMAFIISIEYGGDNELTWFDTIRWANDVEPTPTAVDGKIDVFGFIQIEAGVYLGFIVGQNL